MSRLFGEMLLFVFLLVALEVVFLFYPQYFFFFAVALVFVLLLLQKLDRIEAALSEERRHLNIARRKAVIPYYISILVLGGFSITSIYLLYGSLENSPGAHPLLSGHQLTEETRIVYVPNPVIIEHRVEVPGPTTESSKPQNGSEKSTSEGRDER